MWLWFLVRVYADSRSSNEKNHGGKGEGGRERGKICAFSSYSLPQRFQVWPRFSFRAAASLKVLCEPQKTASYAGCACGIKSLSRNVITYASFVSYRLYCPTIVTLRSHNGDGNENFKKAIGLISKTTILPVHHALLYIFCHHCTTTTWKYLISRCTEEVHKRRRNFLSLSELGYGS